MINILIYILAVMVFYDFYLHLIELIFGYKEAKKLRFYWSPAKIFRTDKRRFYDIFWTSFWGLAFIFLLIIIFI